MNSRTHYTYDDKGRASEYYCGLSGATGGTLGHTYAYTYDDTDNTLTTMTVEGENFNGDTLSYTYDGLKRLSSKSVVGQYRTFAQNYIYKTLVGTRTSTLISGLNVTLQGSSILSYTYSYDSLGNITGIYKNGALAATYGYDDQGQLISEIDHINDLQYIYVYDTYGNIRYVYKFTYSTGTYLGTDTYGYTDTSWLDRLTSFNGANITYDAIGNPLSYNNGSAYTFTWQNGRDLASVVKGGVTTTYKYGADGQRIEKKYGSTTYNYYYVDGLLVRQTWGTHYIDFLYDESGSPYSLIYDGVQYYYVKNVQGDVVQIRSSYGTLLVEYTYDAWGNVLSITGSNASVLGANNPIRYRSYYYDFETGFYYLQSRYYDPAIRRFINADGYVNANGDFIGFNMYAYCGNNPVMGYDPTGEVNWKNIFKAAAVVISVTAIVALTVATAGAVAVAAGVASTTVVAAATTGAVVGGLAAGTSEIVSQCVAVGSDNLDMNAIAIETFGGAVHGAIDGVASSVASVGGRLGCKAGKIVLGGFQAALHSANNGVDNAPEMIGNISMALTGSAIIQCGLFAFDGLTGNLSTSVLEAKLIDGALRYGAKQMSLTGIIRAGANIWRNKEQIFGLDF